MREPPDDIIGQWRSSRQDELAHWGADDFEAIVYDWPKDLRDAFIEQVCIACVDFGSSTKDALISTRKDMVDKYCEVLNKDHKKQQPYHITTLISRHIKQPVYPCRDERRRSDLRELENAKWN